LRRYVGANKPDPINKFIIIIIIIIIFIKIFILKRYVR
jgi:hypothetical protein